jgi:glycosyltransferase involved in cell wall biosynthesis
MKLAHIAIATPRRCGLYETTHELVRALRAEGIDSRIVDPKPVKEYYPGPYDRGVPLADMDWARDTDIVVSHSGHDGTKIGHTSQPIVHVAHGRPLSAFRGDVPIVKYNLERSRLDRYRAAVTFWPEHLAYLSNYWGEKAHLVQAPVNLDYWCPGPTNYDFGGFRGEFNVVMTDSWARDVDTDIFSLIHTFVYFRRHFNKKAKLHIYAANDNPKYQPLLKMAEDGLGLVQTWAADLRPVYRAADAVLSAHQIDTRTVREAMACGTPVVCLGAGIEETAWGMTTLDHEPRAYAENNFNPKNTAKEFLQVCEKAVR